MAIRSNKLRADPVFSTPPPPYGEGPHQPLAEECAAASRSESLLQTVRKTMEEVARMEAKDVVKPHEYLDQMVGTSTGGPIALILRRLCMPIDPYEAGHDASSKRVFGT
ncbi:hypothetical protein BKA70DRAFT_1435194 [Coprinopsis sp. MPI-PUGE-AT-0042]|nr:hypothetical protein BKA70DRAFT_1435194 [Coprinopsis sp. MPI-PUGE-AT-0042]